MSEFIIDTSAIGPESFLIGPDRPHPVFHREPAYDDRNHDKMMIWMRMKKTSMMVSPTMGLMKIASPQRCLFGPCASNS
jgi:hypothetical protein